MIPIDRFRELLGPDCELNDQELEELCRQIHTLAELVVDLASYTLSPRTMTEDTTRVDVRPEVN